MPTIINEAHVAAPAAQVWGQMRDIRWPARLSGLIETVEVTADDRRVCTTADGAAVEETIISVDDERRRTAYSVTESPFGLTHHNASFQVLEDGQASRLIWIVDVLPEEAATRLGPVIEEELQTIVSRISTNV